jgi:hypothetical protein
LATDHNRTVDLRKAALAMPGKKTENYSSEFSSERAPHINKPAAVYK